MKKIFTDSEKWDDLWFRGLNPQCKIIYIYLCDMSDHAGVWEMDYERFEMHTKLGLSFEQFKSYLWVLRDKVQLIPDNKYWIKNYINFQYSKGINKKHRVFDPVFRSIEKHNLPITQVDVKIIEEDAWKPIVDAWNEILPMLSAPRTISKPRVAAMNRLLKDKIDYKDLFNKVSKSDYLIGKSETKWKASFDWVLKPANIIKIQEGNYESTKNVRSYEYE
jgi:hypothetical protein